MHGRSTILKIRKDRKVSHQFWQKSSMTQRDRFPITERSLLFTFLIHLFITHIKLVTAQPSHLNKRAKDIWSKKHKI